MEVRNIAGAGRGVVALRDLAQGEIILREDAYVFVPLVSTRMSLATCITCLLQFPSGAPHPRCDACGEHFCSASCAERSSLPTSHHVKNGECTALRLCRLLCSELSHDDFNHIRAIVAVAVRAQLEGVEECLDEPAKRFRPKVAPEVEVVCSKYAEQPQEMTFGLQVAEHTTSSNAEASNTDCTCAHSSEGAVTFASVARLTANVSRFESDQLEMYRTLSEVYDKLQSENEDELPVISESMFVKLSCAYQCNGFSLWNEHDKEVASGMFGTAAMVNHNCSPNIKKTFEGRQLVFRTIKPVKSGEQLCLSYVDTKLALNLRQWRLSTQYFFDCRCSRCLQELGQ